MKLDHAKSEAALSALQQLTVETKEFNHEDFIRLTFISEKLTDEVFNYFNDLNY